MYVMRKHLINYHKLTEEKTQTTSSDLVSTIKTESSKLTKEYPALEGTSAPAAAEGAKMRVDETEIVEKIERKK